MTSRPLFAAALVAALGACDTPTVPAESAGYDPTALTGFVYHWGPGREIAIYVDPTAAPAGTDLAAAVRDAARVWEAVTRLGEVRLRITATPTDADVIFHHAAAPRLGEAEGCSPFDVGAGGYTFFCIDGETPLVLALRGGPAGRVKMDVAVNRAAADDDAHFRAIVAHELGHVLGIGAHSGEADDLMFGSPRRLTPSDRDARTLRSVFSRRATVAF